jgi:hypothetical protein
MVFVGAEIDSVFDTKSTGTMLTTQVGKGSRELVAGIEGASIVTAVIASLEARGRFCWWRWCGW